MGKRNERDYVENKSLEPQNWPDLKSIKEITAFKKRKPIKWAIRE